MHKWGVGGIYSLNHHLHQSFLRFFLCAKLNSIDEHVFVFKESLFMWHFPLKQNCGTQKDGCEWMVTLVPVVRQSLPKSSNGTFHLYVEGGKEQRLWRPRPQTDGSQLSYPPGPRTITARWWWWTPWWKNLATVKSPSPAEWWAHSEFISRAPRIIGEKKSALGTFWSLQRE